MNRLRLVNVVLCLCLLSTFTAAMTLAEGGETENRGMGGWGGNQKILFYNIVKFDYFLYSSIAA